MRTLEGFARKRIPGNDPQPYPRQDLALIRMYAEADTLVTFEVYKALHEEMLFFEAYNGHGNGD